MGAASAAGGLLFGKKDRAFRSFIRMLAGQGRSTQRNRVGGVSLDAMMDIAGKDGVPHQGREQLRQ
jgi:hypothetical protein